MEKLIDIIEVLIGLCGGIWGILYYTGRLNYTGDKEQRRQERVKKYGWFLIIAIILMLFGSLSLLITTLS